MPKKFGNNTKAAEAKERKDAAKTAERDRKEREVEDALWKDEDKHVMRKQQRKDDKEKKKLEQLEKKQANKTAYDEEMSSIKSAKVIAPTKVTQAEIASHIQKATKKTKPEKTLLHDEVPLEENLNRLQTEEVARNIDEAISILNISNDKVDLHPEKRVKAAYLAFEERRLPLLKEENPNLRLSQLKQMLRKEWMKSPENPLNQEG